MKEIQFDPSSGKVMLEIVFEGNLSAAYTVKLTEKNSNKAVEYYEGDNLNPEDDNFFLPTPVSENEGRILRMIADFLGEDIKNSKNYVIKMNLYQNGSSIGSEQVSGILTGKHQSEMFFIKLII